jgi:O-antigen/teichoic acid export membrane protein
LGVYSPSGVGLALGDIAGKTFVLLVAYRFRMSASSKKLQPTSLLKKYSQFPKFSIFGGLLNNGGTFLVPFVLFHFFGANAAGQYALVDRLISLPLGLAIISVSQAFSTHSARLLRESPEELPRYFKSIVANFALWGLLPLIAGCIAAPSLIAVLFGPQWEQAGTYAQLLALAYYSSVIMGPVNSTLVIMGDMRLQLGWEAARSVSLGAIFGLALYLKWPVETGLFGYAAVTFVVNLAFVWLAWIKINAVAKPDQ